MSSMQQCLHSILLFTLLHQIRSVDVTGWLVNENSTSLELLNWDVYTTIRSGTVKVNSTTGETSCPESPYFLRLHQLAQNHNTTVTLIPNIDPWRCIDPNRSSANEMFCQSYISSIGSTVKSCGSHIQGLSFDFEGHGRLEGAGVYTYAERKAYSVFLDAIQKSMGVGFTVGAAVGAFGFDSYPLGFIPWVDKDIFHENPNLFLDTMSYHTPRDCSIWQWKKDVFVIESIWGISRQQINLGIGYFTTDLKNHNPFKILSEHTWYYSEKCPNVAYEVCICDGDPFPSKKQNFEIGKFVKTHGFRGVFPWAADYDSFNKNNSLVNYIGKGIATTVTISKES